MSTLSPGTPLGPYIIKERLERATRLPVFRAQHRDSKAEVALKVLPSALLKLGDTRKRLDLEVTKLRQLQHPHVLTVQDAGVEGEIIWVAERLPQGVSLADRMTDPSKPLSSPEGLRLFRALAQALDHAHSKGVVHRDLKPQNVRIDEQGRTQLGDFGIERALTPTSTIMGTPAYMAPEIIGKEATPASDRYAFAVMVYQWLCKQLPFDGEDTTKVLLKHLKEPPPPGPMMNLPERARAALLKGLAKDPKDRWPSALAMVQEISDALLGQMAAALMQNMPTTTLTVEKIQPMRWMIRVAMVVALVLAVVVGMWAMGNMNAATERPLPASAVQPATELEPGSPSN